MKTSDTVMSNQQRAEVEAKVAEQCWFKCCKNTPQEYSFDTIKYMESYPKELTQTQAEITWNACIKEVMEWIEEHYETSDYSKWCGYSFSEGEWQAKLKEWGIKKDNQLDIRNHKGKICPYKKILCQEGYCSGCQIWIDWCKSLWE